MGEYGEWVKTILEAGSIGVGVEVHKIDGNDKVVIVRKQAGKYVEAGRLTIDEAQMVSRAIIDYLAEILQNHSCDINSD